MYRHQVRAELNLSPSHLNLVSYHHISSSHKLKLFSIKKLNVATTKPPTLPECCHVVVFFCITALIIDIDGSTKTRTIELYTHKQCSNYNEIFLFCPVKNLDWYYNGNKGGGLFSRWWRSCTTVAAERWYYNGSFNSHLLSFYAAVSVDKSCMHLSFSTCIICYLSLQ